VWVTSVLRVGAFGTCGCGIDVSDYLLSRVIDCRHRLLIVAWDHPVFPSADSADPIPLPVPPCPVRRERGVGGIGSSPPSRYSGKGVGGWVRGGGGGRNRRSHVTMSSR